MPEKRGNIEYILRYLVSTQYCAEILVDRAPDQIIRMGFTLKMLESLRKILYQIEPGSTFHIDAPVM